MTSVGVICQGKIHELIKCVSFETRVKVEMCVMI